jgi:hypothetical protein
MSNAYEAAAHNMCRGLGDAEGEVSQEVKERVVVSAMKR